MVTIDYTWRGGSQKSPKSEYVILEQPHIRKAILAGNLLKFVIFYDVQGEAGPIFTIIIHF